MSTVIRAHFDGKVLVPEEPLQLPIDHPLEIEVRVLETEDELSGVDFTPLYQLIGLASEGPSDASIYHDMRPEEAK